MELRSNDVIIEESAVENNAVKSGSPPEQRSGRGIATRLPPASHRDFTPLIHPHWAKTIDFAFLLIVPDLLLICLLYSLCFGPGNSNPHHVGGLALSVTL